MLGLELLLASHLLLHEASGSPAVCPVQKSARVDVRWRSEPIKYDYTQGLANLASKHIDSDNPYGHHVATDVGGLMSGKIKYQSGIQISSVRYPVSKVTCLWIDKVTVDIVIDPLIQIAREHAKGTCKHTAILEHEHKHVAVDRAVVKDHLDSIRAAASAAVQKVGVVGPKPDAQMDEFKKKMSDYVQEAVKVAADAMYADRTLRQKGIDTKEEYDRVDALCPD